MTVMLEQLNEDGCILIGDVAFETRRELEKSRQETGEEWDQDEIYFVAEEMKRTFPELEFEKVSYCSGIFRLSRKKESAYNAFHD